MLASSPWTPKRAIARHFGIARSTLYLKPRQPERDKRLLEAVLLVMEDHPHYGHRRIALVMGRNTKLVRRIMKKYGLKPMKQRRRLRKRRDERKSASEIPNRIKGVTPHRPLEIWVGDFTHLDFHGTFVYLATVIDRYTREVVGWSMGLHHSAQFVIEVMEDAKRSRGTPEIFHSDQGSEYDSIACRAWLLAHRILPSQSHKAHPWENGHQESFYGHFKEELGELHRFHTLDELMEAIAHQIHYYNTKRIHSALKMTPREKHAEAMRQLEFMQHREPKLLSAGVS